MCAWGALTLYFAGDENSCPCTPAELRVSKLSHLSIGESSVAYQEEPGLAVCQTRVVLLPEVLTV